MGDLSFFKLSYCPCILVNKQAQAAVIHEYIYHFLAMLSFVFCAVCLHRETDIAQFCAEEVESALLLEGNSKANFKQKSIIYHLVIMSGRRKSARQGTTSESRRDERHRKMLRKFCSSQNLSPIQVLDLHLGQLRQMKIKDLHTHSPLESVPMLLTLRLYFVSLE